MAGRSYILAKSPPKRLTATASPQRSPENTKQTPAHQKASLFSFKPKFLRDPGEEA